MRLLQVPRRHLSCSSLKSTASYLNSAPATSPRFGLRIQQTKLRDKKQILPQTQSRNLVRTAVMSYSNTDTGSKPADPYKEKNLDNPDLATKIRDLSTFIKSSKFGMMTTRIPESGLLVSRCMAIAGQEAGGVDLIFHTNTESGKTDDLAKDDHINMSFLNGTGEWASISGTADVIADRDMVHKYYSQELKTWLGDLEDGTHDGGPNDPRIGVIKITAKTATYAISRGTMVGRAAEMVQGAITGKAAQVNKLREISESEIGQWRSQL